MSGFESGMSQCQQDTQSAQLFMQTGVIFSSTCSATCFCLILTCFQGSHISVLRPSGFGGRFDTAGLGEILEVDRCVFRVSPYLLSALHRRVERTAP